MLTAGANDPAVIRFAPAAKKIDYICIKNELPKGQAYFLSGLDPKDPPGRRNN